MLRKLVALQLSLILRREFSRIVVRPHFGSSSSRLEFMIFELITMNVFLFDAPSLFFLLYIEFFTNEKRSRFVGNKVDSREMGQLNWPRVHQTMWFRSREGDCNFAEYEIGK
jgi:hypothetical protein